MRIVEVDGEAVVLDSVAQMSGPGRYRLLESGGAQAVTDGYPQPAYPIHKNVCPVR